MSVKQQETMRVGDTCLQKNFNGLLKFRIVY